MGDLLKKHLNAQLEKPYHSVSNLAKKSGLSEMTVRRIVQGESRPNFETVASILKVTAKREEMMSILRDEFPEMTNAIDRVWGNGETYSICNSVDLTNALSSSLGCYIVNSASCKCGIKRTKIKSLYGTKGESTLNSLLEKGILVETDGIVRYPEEDFSVTGDLISTQIRHFVDAYDAKNPSSARTVQVEGLNEEGIKEAQNALIECAKKIGDIRQDKKYLGNVPFFFCAFSNRIHDENN